MNQTVRINETNEFFENLGLWTVEDLCRYLQVKEARIYRLVHESRIPYLKASRLLRFRKSEIDGWLKAGVRR